MSVLAQSVILFVGSEIQHQLLLEDFEEKKEWLQDELRRMQCFLKDWGVGQDDQRAHRIGELRKLAYYAEDLISKFLLDSESKTQEQSKIYLYKRWKAKRRIIREVKTIRSKLLQINQSHKPSSTNFNQASLRRTPSYSPIRGQTPSYSSIQISGIVGLERETEELLKQIKDKKMVRRCVVPIVGMGGIGKSTLAWKVLNHPHVKDEFTLRAWVTVIGYRDVQIKIFSSTSQTEQQQADWTSMGLNKFSESLKHKYLVVLDDVWGPSQQCGWDDRLLEAFPDARNGSRILITTRVNDVAVYLGTHICTPLTVKHLDDEKSWELFCKKASFTTKDRVLQDLGHKIVRRCGGLPLSIVTLGDRLKDTPQRRREWERFYNKQNGLAAEVLKALEPSYNELTPELQDCFLRLGFFPENHTIPTQILTQLWIAEGLVSEQGEGLEAAAESHLDMLLERNMIQAVETSPDGSIKACRIDNSLHKLSILKAEKVSFLEILKGDKFCPSRQNRHRAIHHSMDRYFYSEDPSSQLHSLVFVVSNGRITLSDLEIVCKRFKLLKLLHLEGMVVERLPEKIGKLLNLRYLNLRNTSIDNLQPSMSNLKKLLTLDIRDNMYVTGLEVIKHMTNLQNLYLPGNYEGLDLNGLCQLRVLKWVKLASTESLKSLAKLTTLHMQLEGQLSLDEFLQSAAESLKKLESLYLYPSIEISSFDTENFKPLENLTKLYIKGGVRQLPSTENFPPNLLQLTLDGSGLIPFRLNDLGKLPKLLILRLRNLYIKDEKLSFSSDIFTRLKYLELLHLWNLKDLELQGKGALGRLRHLKISNCTALNSLPNEMKQLTKLSELHIDKMREAFEQKIQKGGEDHERVQHVHIIKYTNTLKNYEETLTGHLLKVADPSDEKALDKQKMKKELKVNGNVAPGEPQQQQCHSGQNPHPSSLEVFKDRFKSVSARLGDNLVELIGLACEANQHYPGPDGLETGLPQIIANACRTLSDSKEPQPNPLSITTQNQDRSNHPQHSYVQTPSISPSTTILDLSDADKSFSNTSNTNGSLAFAEHQSGSGGSFGKFGDDGVVHGTKEEGDVLEKDHQNRATNFKSWYLKKYYSLLGDKGLKEDDNFVADYVFGTGEDRLILFHDGHHHITREEFSFLGKDDMIYNSIIDAWAKVLNNEENMKHRSQTCKRLFLTTSCFLSLFPQNSQGVSQEYKVRVKSFLTTMNTELTSQNCLSINCYELIFFPIIVRSHFYLICFNMSTKDIDIIDNRLLTDQDTLENKYGDYAKGLEKALITYMKDVQASKQQTIIESMKLNLVEMPWRNNKNSIDCGIYAMRHMETYQGDDTSWDCGLVSKSFDPLKSLRITYCKKLVLSEINKQKEEVVKQAQNRMNGLPEDESKLYLN